MEKIENYWKLSFGSDVLGVVFTKDNKIFRGIRPQKEEYVRELLSGGLINELMQKEMIPETIISKFYSDEFNLILQHKKIPIILEPKYWSFSMLKDAAIHILHVNQIANKHGKQLIDAHPWNITFFQNKPIFIDFGSFVPYTKETANGFLLEYKRLLASLLLMNCCDVYFGRKIIYDGESFYLRTQPAQTIENTMTYSNAVSYFKEYHRKHSSPKLNLMISNVFDKNIFEPEYISQIFSYPVQKSAWGNYQLNFYNSLKNNKKNNEQYIRFQRIIQLCKKYADGAQSSIDLAGNSGGFLYLLSKEIPMNFYLSIDYDEKAIEEGYIFFKEHPTKVDLALHNFTASYQPVTKADTVFALAITHHLLLAQNIQIDTIFSQIKQYANKYVFIEFMPLGLWGGEEVLPEIPEWYNEHWFEKNFKKYFSLLHKEQLEKNRIIFVGKIK